MTVGAEFPCRACGQVWTGHTACHCPTCHETFSSVDTFDRHRMDFVCRDPAERGLIRDSRGFWSRGTAMPEEAYRNAVNR